jgi:hypothetical protein
VIKVIIKYGINSRAGLLIDGIPVMALRHGVGGLFVI